MDTNAFDLLKQYGPCCERWLKKRTAQQALEECKRGDWLLWAYVNLYPERDIFEVKHKVLLTVLPECAETVKSNNDISWLTEKAFRARDAVCCPTTLILATLAKVEVCLVRDPSILFVYHILEVIYLRVKQIKPKLAAKARNSANRRIANVLREELWPNGLES